MSHRVLDRIRYLPFGFVILISIALSLNACKEEESECEECEECTECDVCEECEVCEECVDPEEVLACPEPTGDVQTMTPRMYFEYQSTDNDTGIHGLMGGIDWAEMCVTMPDGTAFMAVKPRGNLQSFGVADLFFESREPEASEVSMEEILSMFPAGEYRVIGTTYEGESYEAFANVTHDIPAAPVILGPEDEAEVDPNNVVIEWEPVTETVFGDPVTITGYEIIVSNEDRADEDPHGMSHPVASIHVRPDVTSLTIPAEFFEPGTEYELEVIAIEESGNQTITVQFFDTIE